MESYEKRLSKELEAFWLIYGESYSKLQSDAREYPIERPLGARAEWHHLHRKVGKLQRPLWDGEDVPMREDIETILKEIMSHAALAIRSLRLAEFERSREEAALEREADEEPCWSCSSTAEGCEECCPMNSLAESEAARNATRRLLDAPEPER